MKLSKQALGAIMMTLQKSLMEQSDIVPMLENFNLATDENDSTLLHVVNPPVVSFEGVKIEETFDADGDSEDSEE
tara:strand:- start:67 stop:291 length:225 start_codon:yes stop_codon:yes gene_type:complete